MNRYNEAKSAFDFTEQDQVVFGNTFGAIAKAMGETKVKGLNLPKMAKISSVLLKQGSAATVRDVEGMFNNQELKISPEDAKAFHGKFLESFSEFTNEASDNMQAELRASSGGDVQNLVSAGMSEAVSRKRAQGARSQAPQVGMFSSGGDVKQAGAASQRYLEHADELIQQMGSEAAINDEGLRNQIAHDLSSADRAQMLDLHNSGGKGGSIFGQKVSNNTAVMVQILQRIANNTKKGD